MRSSSTASRDTHSNDGSIAGSAYESSFKYHFQSIPLQSLKADVAACVILSYNLFVKSRDPRQLTNEVMTALGLLIQLFYSPTASYSLSGSSNSVNLIQPAQTTASLECTAKLIDPSFMRAFYSLISSWQQCGGYLMRQVAWGLHELFHPNNDQTLTKCAIVSDILTYGEFLRVSSSGLKCQSMNKSVQSDDSIDANVHLLYLGIEFITYMRESKLYQQSPSMGNSNQAKSSTDLDSNAKANSHNMLSSASTTASGTAAKRGLIKSSSFNNRHDFDERLRPTSTQSTPTKSRISLSMFHSSHEDFADAGAGSYEHNHVVLNDAFHHMITLLKLKKSRGDGALALFQPSDHIISSVCPIPYYCIESLELDSTKESVRSALLLASNTLLSLNETAVQLHEEAKDFATNPQRVSTAFKYFINDSAECAAKSETSVYRNSSSEALSTTTLTNDPSNDSWSSQLTLSKPSKLKSASRARGLSEYADGRSFSDDEEDDTNSDQNNGSTNDYSKTRSSRKRSSVSSTLSSLRLTEADASIFKDSHPDLSPVNSKSNDDLTDDGLPSPSAVVPVATAVTDASMPLSVNQAVTIDSFMVSQNESVPLLGSHNSFANPQFEIQTNLKRILTEYYHLNRLGLSIHSHTTCSECSIGFTDEEVLSSIVFSSELSLHPNAHPPSATAPLVHAKDTGVQDTSFLHARTSVTGIQSPHNLYSNKYGCRFNCPRCSTTITPLLTLNLFEYQPDAYSSVPSPNGPVNMDAYSHPKLKVLYTSVVPYLTPQKLRTSYEEAIELLGDRISDPIFLLKNFPHILWNHVWYTKRLNLPLGLRPVSRDVNSRFSPMSSVMSGCVMTLICFLWCSVNN
jgi:hypothetical protein